MTEDDIHSQSIELLEKSVEFAKELEASPIVFEISICMLLKIALESSSNEAYFLNAITKTIRESAIVRSTIN